MISEARWLAPLTFGPFTFDRHNRILRTGNREIALPPRVLGVLELLTARAGEVVPRQDLIDSVWKEAFVTDTSLAEAVSVLRQALGDDPQTPTYIQTVHRRGYRFVAPVGEGLPPPPAEVDRPAKRELASDIVSPSIGGQLVPWSVAALCSLLTIVAVWQFTHREPLIPPMVRMRIEPAAGTRFDVRAPALAVAPDASKVAWSGCDNAACRLYVRPLDRLEPAAVPGTEDASAPFFSPNGAWIGFFAGGKLKKVSLAGGGPLVLADAPQTFGAVWLPSGRIVFAASAYGGLLQVSDRGGDTTPFTQPSAEAGEIRHAWPSSVNGGPLVFSIVTSPLEDAAGRIAAMASDRGPARGSWRTVIDAADAARAIGPTYIAFSRGGELHAVAFDAARLATAGVEQVVRTGLAPLQFAISDTGALLYGSGNPDAQPSIAGLREQRSMTGLPPAPGLAALQMPAVSIDGRLLAGVSGDTSSSDIWVADVERGAMTRLTHGGINVAPVWSADGASVVFSAAKRGPFELWMRDAAAEAPERRILEPRRGRHVFPTSVSRDGRLLAFVESGGATRADIWTMLFAGGPPAPIVQTLYDDVNGVLSHDGGLLAYQSDESGRWQIYLMRLSDKHRVSVSTAGGTRPFWSPDGRTLLYVSGTDLVAVAVDPDGGVGAPHAIRSIGGAEPVALFADQIVLRQRGDTGARQAVLTLEWIRELRQTLGPPAAALPR